jgi:putative PIN family toxin of toxin-antitoxin system
MKRKAVLDSSVLVSAFIKPQGTTAKLLHAAKGGAFVLCLSREILAETAEVLLRPKIAERYRRQPNAAQEFCAGLSEVAQPVRRLPRLRGAVPLDPKDDKIVATAVKAQAAYLERVEIRLAGPTAGG